MWENNSIRKKCIRHSKPPRLDNCLVPAKHWVLSLSMNDNASRKFGQNTFITGYPETILYPAGISCDGWGYYCLERADCISVNGGKTAEIGTFFDQ